MVEGGFGVAQLVERLLQEECQSPSGGFDSSPPKPWVYVSALALGRLEILVMTNKPTTKNKHKLKKMSRL